MLSRCQVCDSVIACKTWDKLRLRCNIFASHIFWLMYLSWRVSNFSDPQFQQLVGRTSIRGAWWSSGHCCARRCLGKKGERGKLGQERLEVRWEAVMFLFNLVIWNVWLFLFDYLAKCFVEVVVIMFGCYDFMLVFNVCSLVLMFFPVGGPGDYFPLTFTSLFGLNEGDNCWGGQSFYV